MNITERETLLEQYKTRLADAEKRQLAVKEELREIIKSLERDMPKEPINNTCPYCGRLFFIKTNFCSDCGQAMR
jgi:uncharacterized OB-fold protein